MTQTVQYPAEALSEDREKHLAQLSMWPVQLQKMAIKRAVYILW